MNHEAARTNDHLIDRRQYDEWQATTVFAVNALARLRRLSLLSADITKLQTNLHNFVHEANARGYF